jgi:hypothetical protein
MTTKKLLAIVLGLLGAFALLVALFVGAIVGIALYAINQSEAASTAKQFLKENEKLKQDIGEVQDFGRFVTGSINTSDSAGTATLNLKVLGARRTVNATVSLVYGQGRRWMVTEASYVNEEGQTVYLLDKYGRAPAINFEEHEG